MESHQRGVQLLQELLQLLSCAVGAGAEESEIFRDCVA